MEKKSFMLNLDVGLHEQFKQFCQTNGLSMTGVLTQLITQVIQRDYSEKAYELFVLSQIHGQDSVDNAIDRITRFLKRIV